MGSATAFGLGTVLGVLAAFAAGRRYERAHHASVLAAEYVGAARHLAGKAVGGLLLVVVVVVIGSLIVAAAT